MPAPAESNKTGEFINLGPRLERPAARAARGANIVGFVFGGKLASWFARLSKLKKQRPQYYSGQRKPPLGPEFPSRNSNSLIITERNGAQLQFWLFPPELTNLQLPPPNLLSCFSERSRKWPLNLAQSPRWIRVDFAPIVWALSCWQTFIPQFIPRERK